MLKVSIYTFFNPWKNHSILQPSFVSPWISEQKWLKDLKFKSFSRVQLRTHVQTKEARRADYQYDNGDSKRQIANPPIDHPKPGTENPTPPTEEPTPPTVNPKLRPPEAVS